MMIFHLTLKYKARTLIVGFFYSCQFIKSFRPFHSFWEEEDLSRRSIQAFRMTPLSYHNYSVSGSSSQKCSGIPLKLLCLFSSILVHQKNFLVKYLISIDLLGLSETKYKSKLSHGLTCHFMLDRLCWCAKQWNRTSVLLGELWYTCISQFSLNLHFSL